MAWFHSDISRTTLGLQEINKLHRRHEDSEGTSQELRLAREQLQNTVSMH